MKAQLAVFVIIAIFIVGITAMFALIQREAIKASFEKLKTPAEIRPVSAFVSSCLERTAKDALVFTGQQGGYFLLPQAATDSIPYYFYEHKNVMPSKQEIEKSISSYIDEMLPFCTKNFYDFPQFTTEARQPKTETRIIKNKVRIALEYPITIKKGNTVFMLESFSAEIPSRLETIYDVATNITSQQLEDSSKICLSCLIKLGIDNDLYIDMSNYGNDTVIFKITDEQFPIDNFAYEFVFANKYRT